MKSGLVLSLLGLIVLLSSCEIVGGIFKAGMGVGIFLVVLVLVIIAVITFRLRK